ncbi:hypothetical protein DVH05_000978 [Phytophthora capsici]|nr:hypothetical protein DVH05_000978 [Phytophthora capsici]
MAPHVSYERLKIVPLPAEISALPHVLNFLDMLLKTPEEALNVAIETNDLKWVQQILDRFRCGYKEAIELAAGLNRLDVVNLIITDILTGCGESSMAIEGVRFNMESIMENGALSAARNGHTSIVERLLPMTIDPHDPHFSTDYLWSIEVEDIMTEGAVHGHLSVVKLMVEHALALPDEYRNGYPKWTIQDDTLAKSILAGQIGVAEFLIHESGISWDLKNAFIIAVNKGEAALAEIIRERYPQQVRGQVLFIDLACSGDLNAVEYLYKNGCNDSELVERALSLGVTKGQTEIVEFLASRVSSEAFEKAFERACSGDRPECIDTVMVLYKLNRASRQCIERGFINANTLAVVKFLYENEKISDQAIIAEFDNAAQCYYIDHSDIILFLYEHQWIPSNLIDKAYQNARGSLYFASGNAKARRYIQLITRVITSLRDDERLSPKFVGTEFVAAAASNKKEIMLFLYDKRRTSPEFLVEAFVEATHSKHTEVVKEILKLLSVEEHVPRKFMHETFVAAARHGQMSVLQDVCENLTADLPLEVLKSGLEVAGNDEVERFIREMVCDQVSKEHA